MAPTKLFFSCKILHRDYLCVLIMEFHMFLTNRYIAIIRTVKLHMLRDLAAYGNLILII